MFLTRAKHQFVLLGCLCFVGTLRRVARQTANLPKRFGGAPLVTTTQHANASGSENKHGYLGSFAPTSWQPQSLDSLLRKQEHQERQQEEDERVSALKQISLRYFLYDDPNITQCDNDSKAYQNENGHILQAFRHHPLRTYDTAEADLYIVPMNFHAMTGHQVVAAFRALLAHPTFCQTAGHGHVFVATGGRLFDGTARGGVTNPGGVIKNVYATQLENVTVARDVDYIALRAAYRTLPYIWKKLVGRYKPLVSRMFSVGLLPTPIDFVPASYEKFQTAPLDIFYRTRREPSFSGSTPFRFAPLVNITYDATLWRVSVGHDLDMASWYRDMSSAKFCLVIRGDTPHTHALLRAVQVGCIPVIISDVLDIWAPTLRHSLSMRDYAIFIPEDDFMANPQQVLLGTLQTFLQNTTAVKAKIAQLQYAQQVASLEHASSLFVPAFLKEAVMADPGCASTFRGKM